MLIVLLWLEYFESSLFVFLRWIFKGSLLWWHEGTIAHHQNRLIVVDMSQGTLVEEVLAWTPNATFIEHEVVRARCRVLLKEPLAAHYTFLATWGRVMLLLFSMMSWMQWLVGGESRQLFQVKFKAYLFIMTTNSLVSNWYPQVSFTVIFLIDLLYSLRERF